MVSKASEVKKNEKQSVINSPVGFKEHILDTDKCLIKEGKEERRKRKEG